MWFRTPHQSLAPALFVSRLYFPPLPLVRPFTFCLDAQAEPEYDTRRCLAFVCDISKDELALPPECLDAIVLIFVLSALRPERYVRDGQSASLR